MGIKERIRNDLENMNEKQLLKMLVMMELQSSTDVSYDYEELIEGTK